MMVVIIQRNYEEIGAYMGYFWGRKITFTF